MKWAQTIWNMSYRENKSPQEIVEYFNNPLVTEIFVDTVLQNVSYLKIPPPRPMGTKNKKKHLRTKIPRPGTKLRTVWNYVQEHLGGTSALAELLKTRSIGSIAREHNLEYFILRDYKTVFITGRYHKESPVHKKIRAIIKRNMKRNQRPSNPKTMGDLW
jgi:hypothetical protein